MVKLQLMLAFGASLSGMMWLALSLLPHWRQALGEKPLSKSRQKILRILGYAALTFALGLCLRVDHASMAVLVWMMAMSGAAFCVAMLFAWRPRWSRAWVFFLC